MSTPSRALALRVVELACRAPSVHNTQPWRWRVVDDATIELYADPHRRLPVSDPAGRNLALSCGAAIHHGLVAARALGLTATADLVPLPDDETLLARIELTPGRPPGDALDVLRAIDERRTDRRRFTSWPIPDSRLVHLAKAASGWGARAVPLTDVTARFRAEQLLERAMELQNMDPRFAEEQRAWTGRSSADGMPVANAVPPVRSRRPTRANRFASDSEAQAIQAAAAGRVVESTDGLVAICTATDDKVSWLKAGEALSALWLQATRDGLSIVPISQVVEVEETRHVLRQDVFDGMAHPQILVRVGWQETSRSPLDRTPRRGIDQVTGPDPS